MPPDRLEKNAFITPTARGIVGISGPEPRGSFDAAQGP